MLGIARQRNVVTGDTFIRRRIQLVVGSETISYPPHKQKTRH